MRVGMSEDCFVTGEDNLFALDARNRLHLRHDLFDDDAIILRDVLPVCVWKAKRKSRSGNGNKGAALSWNLAYASYRRTLCLHRAVEFPSSRKGVVEDLETQENLQALKAKGYYSGFFTLKLKEAV